MEKPRTVENHSQVVEPSSHQGNSNMSPAGSQHSYGAATPVGLQVSLLNGRVCSIYSAPSLYVDGGGR